MLSISLAHLVAHEAYPGHHTEHCRKEVGLVRRRRWWEESIFLVGTPQCLIAEGLADLGLGNGPRPPARERRGRPPASPRHPLRRRRDRRRGRGGRSPGAVRGNAAWRLYVDGADPDVVIDEVARWALLPPMRAAKAVEFLLHPTWRAYISCYVEGLPLCRTLRRRRSRPLRPSALRATGARRSGTRLRHPDRGFGRPILGASDCPLWRRARPGR